MILSRVAPMIYLGPVPNQKKRSPLASGAPRHGYYCFYRTISLLPRLLSYRTSRNQTLFRSRHPSNPTRLVQHSRSGKSHTLHVQFNNHAFEWTAYLKSHFSPHSPSHCLRRKSRSQKLLAELLSFDADILCLQELDEYEQFYKVELCKHGYSSIYLQRPGRTDGSGIFYRSRRFEVIETQFIQYNDLIPGDDTVMKEGREPPQTSMNADHENEAGRGDPNDPKVRFRRDCVAIMAAFRVLPSFDKIFLLANTQIYWDPDWADVKFAQVEYLVDHVLKFQDTLQSKLLCKIPVILCGDFNSMPGDQVYNYLVSGASLECSTPSNPCLNSKNKVIRRCALPLHSLYASVQREPDFTNCTPVFVGTLDYIFFSSFDSMKPISLLQTPTIDAEDVMGGLPNQSHPSDHLPIGTDFVVLASEKA